MTKKDYPNQKELLLSIQNDLDNIDFSLTQLMPIYNDISSISARHRVMVLQKHLNIMRDYTSDLVKRDLKDV